MGDRRSLVEGIAGKAEPEAEKKFVYGGKEEKQAAAPAAGGGGLSMASRIPITTRARPELAMALKRASLERQLRGEAPYYVQDILEEALTAWLKSHGHLD